MGVRFLFGLWYNLSSFSRGAPDKGLKNILEHNFFAECCKFYTLYLCKDFFRAKNRTLSFKRWRGLDTRGGQMRGCFLTLFYRACVCVCVRAGGVEQGRMEVLTKCSVYGEKITGGVFGQNRKKNFPPTCDLKTCYAIFRCFMQVQIDG